MNNKRGSSVEMVNLLLDEGADPNYQPMRGPTALHLAVETTELSSDVQHRIVTLLLKHGADTSLTDFSNQTPAQKPEVRPEIQQLLANADSLRQSFLARGGIAVARDRPSTPPVIAQPTVADSALQRVVGGAAQAVGAVGAAVQPLVAAAGAGIISGLGGSQPAAMPQAVVVSDDEVLNLFDQKNGALAMGNDVHVTECTLQEAARKCLNLDAAVGFTFAPTAALPGGRYRCYFKSSKKKNSDPLWQTYLQKSTAPSAVAARVVQVVSTAPAVQLPAVPPVQPAAEQYVPAHAQDAVAAAKAGCDDTGQAEMETSDYNLRRLERRIKNLQATLSMLTEMGEDTTDVQEDIAVQVSVEMLILSLSLSLCLSLSFSLLILACALASIACVL